MHRKRQSMTRAARRGAGVFYLPSAVLGVKFRWRKGSTSREWKLSLENKVEI